MHRISFKIGKYLVAATAVLVGLFGAQSSVASAAPAATGVTRVTAISASDSTTTKTVSAVCPAGQRVFGGGAEIVNGQRRVLLERFQPSHTATEDQFVAGASELASGYAGAWQLQAFAICGAPLAGMQIIEVTGPATSNSPQSATGICPEGQREVGFGGRISNGAGQVVLTDLADFFGPPSSLLLLGGREDANGYAGSWSLSSYTVCADESAADGFVLAGTTSSTDSNDKSVTVTCPAGTQVYSAGMLLRAQGVGTTASLVLDQVSVDPSLTSATVRVVEAPEGTPGTWTLLGSTLCGPAAAPK